MTQNENTGTDSTTEASSPEVSTTEAGSPEASAPPEVQSDAAAPASEPVVAKKRARAPRKRATSPAKAPGITAPELPGLAAEPSAEADAAAEPPVSEPEGVGSGSDDAAMTAAAPPVAAAPAVKAPAKKAPRRATRAAKAPAPLTTPEPVLPIVTEPAASAATSPESIATPAESAPPESAPAAAAESVPSASAESAPAAAAAESAPAAASAESAPAAASAESAPAAASAEPTVAVTPSAAASSEAVPSEDDAEVSAVDATVAEARAQVQAPSQEEVPAAEADRSARVSSIMPIFQAPPAETPRRARRAASRPAGPPVHAPEAEPGEPAATVTEPVTAQPSATGSVTAPSATVDAPAGSGSGDEAPRRNRSRSRRSRPSAEPFTAPSADDEAAAREARVRAVIDRHAVTEPAAEPDASGDAVAVNDAPGGHDTHGGHDAPGVVVEDEAPLLEDDAEEPAEDAEASTDDDSDTDGDEGGPRRRRRRGGRGRRGRTRSDEPDGETEDAPAAEADTEDEPAEGESEAEDTEASEEGTTSSGTRRRRRRRRGGGGGDTEPSPDDPPNTVVRVREARQEVTGVRGSTRLEAKKQRRREGRDAGRRKNVITEAEFLARRESVDRTMLVRQLATRTQIAVLEDDVLVEHYVARDTQTSMVGNVYLGKVQNVLPSMEAAFVDIGKGRNAVLYAGEVNWDAAGLEGQPRRIEHALKAGESVLVQVTKDPIGHKGARLTSQISLAGRYLVYVPDGSMTGISRKLPDTERARLKKILKAVVPEDAGVIVRTAAEGASEDELERDVLRLQAQWEDITAKTSKSGGSSGPVLLHGEPDLAIKVVRDIFNEDFASLVISGDEAWDTLQGYIGHVAPHLGERVSRWEGDQDIFAAHRVDEQLGKALDRKVWLPSGGSLVIDRTEAMTVVDVNTGKFTGSGGNLEETVTRNNLEAAEEVVRQLRLRDIGGIIVVDFIDMVLESNRDLVLRRLMECLGRDRTRHQVAEVTSLGLVQMTRKRVGQGLLEVFGENCEHCNGRGVIVHDEPIEKQQAHETTGDHHPSGSPSGAGGGNGNGRRRSPRGRGGAESAAEPAAAPVTRNPEVVAQIAAVAGAGGGG